MADVYALNIEESKFIKNILTNLNGKIEYKTRIAWDFNNPTLQQ